MGNVIRTSNACLLDIYDNCKKLSQQERRVFPLMNVLSDNNWRTNSLVLAIAAVLDPRFKFDFVEFSYNTIYGHDAARIHLAMIRNTEPIISCNSYFDILGWWCEQAPRFPFLGRMVQDILAIPMSSFISGYTFNEKVMMDNPIFCDLPAQIIEALVCGRDLLESPKKFSNVKPNKGSGNIGCPIVNLEDSPAPEIAPFSLESGKHQGMKI
ncbi:hypothetical protein PTKIN_Ptkin09bG0269100 [Pterospermum kingtungense]